MTALELASITYLALLRHPHDLWRMENQRVLINLREFISERTGINDRDVQESFESQALLDPDTDFHFIHKGNRPMKTSYFTFGQSHRYVIGDVVYDKDCVLRIVANNPRAVMLATFGTKWAMQYDDEPPDLEWFPRGILEHWDNPGE